MSEKKFLTESEHKKLLIHFNKVETLKNSLGQAAITKELAIRQANAEFEHFLAKNDIESKTATESLNNYVSHLNDIYGENTYRPSDGEIIPPEKPKKPDAAK